MKIKRMILLLSLVGIQVFAQGGGNLIDLSSSGDNYINCGSPASLEISSTITVEAWIFPTQFDGANEVYAKVGGNKSGNPTGSNFSHSIELRGGRPYYRISHNGTVFIDVAGNTLSLNTWSHIVLMFDGSYIYGYVNGKLDASSFSSGVIYTSTSNPFLIGDYMYSNWPFKGKIDEVRVWNTALSQSTLRDWMHKEVTSSHPNYSNLKGYWKLNETSGATTAADASGNSATGTLVNTCTWTTSTAPIGSEGAFVNTTSQTNIGPSGGQLKTTITSTPDNSNNLGVYQFGSVSGQPVTGGETFPGGIDKRSNIVWGIAERGSVTASLVFDYSNVGGIGDPSTIKLMKRTDASSTTWTEVTLSSRDDVNKTLTVTGATEFSEFALGAGSDNSLPVTLTDFSAKVVSNGVTLTWSTESEVENPGFVLEKRSIEQSAWSKVANYLTDAELESHGSTTEAHHYSFTDNSVAPGMTYTYLLSDVNYAGAEKKHTDKTATITIPANQPGIAEVFHLGEVYPHPFNATFTIPLTLGKSFPVKITLCDLNGKVVKVIENGIKPAGEYRITVDCQDLSSGIYLLQSNIKNIAWNQKVVLLR